MLDQIVDIYRDKGNLWRKKLLRMNQGSNFLKGRLSNRDNVIAPTQFRREKQFQHLEH